jgi:hypothetical protein
MPGWVSGRGMSKEEWTNKVRFFFDKIVEGEYPFLSVIQLPFPFWLRETAGDEAAVATVKELVLADKRLKWTKDREYQDYVISRNEEFEGKSEHSEGSPDPDREGGSPADGGIRKVG